MEMRANELRRTDREQDAEATVLSNETPTTTAAPSGDAVNASVVETAVWDWAFLE